MKILNSLQKIIFLNNPLFSIVLLNKQRPLLLFSIYKEYKNKQKKSQVVLKLSHVMSMIFSPDEKIKIETTSFWTIYIKKKQFKYAQQKFENTLFVSEKRLKVSKTSKKN